MNLYRLENEIGSYWVIANHPTEAELKLMAVLNDADYGFVSKRKVVSITLIAESISDYNCMTGKFLIQ